MLNGRRTTLQLERYVWQNAERIAQRTNRSLTALLDDVFMRKGKMPMAPAVRLLLMLFYTHYADRFPHHIAPQTTDDSVAITAAEPPPDDAQQSYHQALQLFQEIAAS